MPPLDGRGAFAAALAMPLLALLSGAQPSSPSASPGDLVVNEVDYDNPGADDMEFVELKNVSGGPLDMAGLAVVLINGANSPGTEYDRFALPDETLASGDYFVLGAAAVPGVDLVISSAGFIQNGAPDAVAVVEEGANTPADDVVIDSVSYEGDTAGGAGGGGSWTEGSGAGLDDSTTAAFLGISRHPDGTDTDVNNADLSQRCISPGQANLDGDTGCADPAGTATATPAASTTATATGGATATSTGGATASPTSGATASPTSGATASPTSVVTASPTSGATASPTAGATPTATSLPPTATSAPPTATSAPATATSAPATATSPSPTATSAPPTATVAPPTSTSPPSTATVPPPTPTGAPATATSTPATPQPTPTLDSLAVEIVDLRAIDVGDAVVLRWRTLSEIDQAGWLIYRGLPGFRAQVVPRVLPALGNTLAGADYTVRIAEPAAPPYWLADVDTRGRITLHGPVVPYRFHAVSPGEPR